MTDGEERSLEAYIRENRGAVTEDALRAAAIAAGHPPEAVDAALVATRPTRPPVDRRRITRVVFAAYLVVFGVLAILMSANADQSGMEGYQSLAIMVLAGALFVGFLFASSWIAGSRLPMIVLGLGIALFGLGNLSGLAAGGLLAAGFGLILVFAAASYGERIRMGPSTELLMIVPLLLLLAIGGACLATGLPLGRGA